MTPADADYADTEFLYNALMQPALTAAIDSLGLRAGWRVLDAGCGPGGVLPLLHAAVSPGGAIVGLDLSVPHVERARTLVWQRGLQDSVSLEVADLCADLPIADATFDAVWSADVLYPDTVGDPLEVVARLKRTLRPGGVLAIFYGNWLRPIYLPGYARLEHLICAAREALYTHERAWQGEPHPERALSWLQRAGFTNCQVSLSPVVHQQPLPDAVRRYIQTAIFAHHYQRAIAEGGTYVGMTAADRDLWSRLTDPQHPDYLLDRPDYYCALTPLLAAGEQPR
jgi:arsenite methyltransferase